MFVSLLYRPLYYANPRGAEHAHGAHFTFMQGILVNVIQGDGAGAGSGAEAHCAVCAASNFAERSLAASPAEGRKKVICAHARGRAFSAVTAVVFALALLALVSNSAFAQQITLTAAARPDQVIAGETFAYVLTVESIGEERIPQPQLPSFGSFQIVGRQPPSQSMSMSFGGPAHYAQTWQILLQAPKPGQFIIQPATLQSGEKTLASNAVQVSVTAEPPEMRVPEGATSARTGYSDLDRQLRGKLFLISEPSKKDPVPYEPIFLRTWVYKAPNLTQNERYEFGDAPSGADETGFLRLNRQQADSLAWQTVKVGDREFQRSLVQTDVIVPTRSGEIRVSGAPMRAVLRVSGGRRRPDPFGDSIFGMHDPFADMFMDNQVRAELPAQVITIQARPFPQPAPDGFKGIAGDFNVSSSVDRPQAKEGEVVTLRIKFEGEGYVEAIPEPVLPALDGFTLFDKKSTPQTQADAKSVRGQKTFEFLLRASKPGHFEIPACSFVLFSPKSNRYEEKKTLPIKVEILPDESHGPTEIVMAAARSGQAGGSGDIRQLGADIEHIYTGPWRPGTSFAGAALYARPGWWALHALPPVFLLAAFFARKRRQFREENPDTIRRGRAASEAGKRLRTARRLLAENKIDEFFAEVASAVRGYLGGKLGREPAGLTIEEIERTLRERNAPSDTLQMLREILETCDAARYAPGALTEETRKGLLEKCEKVFSALREVLK